jgi:hypothetical protein
MAAMPATFMQLKALLENNGVQITTAMLSKKAMMEEIKMRGINSETTPTTALKWILERGRYGEFAIQIEEPSKFLIRERDVITFADNKSYEIYEIELDDPGIWYDEDVKAEDHCVITLENTKDKKTIKVKAAVFINVINTDNVVYHKSLWIDYVNRIRDTKVTCNVA